ncbi:MAG: hypothetical protein ABIX01_10580 [Chitinophagaceae bacterium]
MGLSIHYSGRFNESASLKDLIEEVKDVAEIYKWKYAIFEESFPADSLGKVDYDPENIYGILFSPPGCEPVYLSFLSNGRMSGPPFLQFWGRPNNKSEAAYLYMLSTKTQFAGATIHKLVIHLLRHLSQKYLLDFKLTDEGHYWETGDEQLLDETFAQYTSLIDGFATVLETLPPGAGENFTAYFERLMKLVEKRYKK